MRVLLSLPETHSRTVWDSRACLGFLLAQYANQPVNQLGDFHWAFLERFYYYSLLCALHYSFHFILLRLGYFKSI